MCYTPPSPQVVSPRSRVLSSLSSPSLWPLLIHGNDKTATERAISEVGTSTPSTSLCSSVASFALHSRPGAGSHERPSRLVCRKSKPVTYLDLPFTRFNYAGLTSIKKPRTRSAVWNGIYYPHRPNIARPVEVGIFPSLDMLSTSNSQIIVLSMDDQKRQLRSSVKSVSWTILSRTSTDHFL